MQTNIRTIRLAILAVLALGACSKETAAKGKEAVESAKQDLAQVQKDLAEKQARYREEANDKLSELDAKLADLKSRAQAAQGDAKVELDKLVASLGEQRKHVSEKLAELGHTTADAWSSFTAQLDKSMHDLEHSIDKALEKP